MIFNAYTFSDIGGKAKNEDSVWINNEKSRLFAIVADGLGSHGGGEIASAAVVETIRRNLPARGFAEPAELSHCVKAANAAVIARQKPGLAMKSTVVLLAVEENMAFFAHVGDSRGYMFRNGRIIHQTLDHSVSQLSVLRGEITSAQIRFHESRNQLMRALGGEESVSETISAMPPLFPGDAFLLCTDGFWEYVTEIEMETDLVKSANTEAWVSYMLARIGKRAVDGRDNLSAIAVICGGAR